MSRRRGQETQKSGDADKVCEPTPLEVHKEDVRFYWEEQTYFMRCWVLWSVATLCTVYGALGACTGILGGAWHQFKRGRLKRAKDGAASSWNVAVVALTAAVLDLLLVVILVMFAVLYVLETCEAEAAVECRGGLRSALAVLAVDAVVFTHMVLSFMAAVRMRECNDFMEHLRLS